MSITTLHDCSVVLPDMQFTHSLNHAHLAATVTGGGVTLASGAASDCFNDPKGRLTRHTAPVLLAPVDNRQPFTFTARVAPQLLATYDAGALYLYASDLLWQKLAFERDERGVARVVSVRTVDTSDDNNHQSLTGHSAYLKISSDTALVGLYYSADNVEWDLARLYKNDYPAALWLGVGAQSPVGAGSAATFDQLSLTLHSVGDFRRGI